MFTKLKGFIGDNPKAIKVLDEIKAAQDTLATNFNSMEVKFNEAVSGRDRVKETLRLVKSKFGLEELNEDTLSTVLNGKDGEQSKVEIENLKQTLAQEVKKRDEVETSYKTKLQTVVLDNTFANSGLVDLASNKDTFEILKGLAKNGASFDDNNQLMFKNDDGSTRMIDGRAMTLDDKIKEISDNESYAGLFKAGIVGGSDTPPVNGQGGQPQPFGTMSAVEIMKQGRK